jgi:hypothetical protein
VNWQHVNINHVNVYGRWGEGTITHVSGWSSWSGTHWSGTHVSGFDPYGANRLHGDRAGEFNWHSGGYAAGRDSSLANVARACTATAARGNVDTAARANVDTNRAAQAGRDTSVGRDAGAWNNGRVYGDRDGNVYQHGDDGWQKRTADGWQHTDDRRATEDLDRDRAGRDLGQSRVDDGARRGGFDEERFGGERERGAERVGGERFGGRGGGRRR